MKKTVLTGFVLMFAMSTQGCAGMLGLGNTVDKAADFVLERYCEGDTAEQDFVKAKVTKARDAGQVTAFDVKCAP